ncbi:MAG TPA: iron ABC transporter permease [Phototrophicaceae bacterium]|nr:iron ABC transporter permease [Phototrophicaceae bacterium]
MTTTTPTTSIPAVRELSQPAALTYPHLGVRRMVLVALVLGLLAAFALSLAVGSVNIPLHEIITILTGGEATRAAWSSIILNFRLPKALTALLAGAALSVSGVQMQTLFRNPLADPYVLGISSGASLGVALVILAAGTTGSVLLAGLGLLGDFGLAAAAAFGAAVVLALVLLVARRVQSVVTLLILGLMFGYVTGALVSLLMYFSIADHVQIYLSWTFGSFGGVTWNQMRVFAPAIIGGLVIALMLVKPLNALLLGETYARSLGVNVRQLRRWLILSTALLAGAVTAFCGPIGFLGIAVPHLCRGIFGTSDHRTLIPASILLGGMVALLADWVAQVPGSQIILPLNAITALLGAPVVIWIILRRRSLRASLNG